MGILDNIRFGVGNLVSYVHEDTGEFLKAAADPTYVEKKFRTSLIGKTQEERDLIAKEANAYTKSVIEDIAPNVETAQVTARQTALAAGAAAATIATGGTVLAAGGMALTSAQLEEFALDLQQPEGEAPIRSLQKVHGPFTGDYGLAGNFALDYASLKGDAHYKNGGTPDAHPDRLNYLASQQAAAESVAMSPDTTSAQPDNHVATGKTTKTKPSFFEQFAQGFTEFFTKLFEKISGAVQYVFGYGKKDENLVASTAPVTNHPRSDMSAPEIVNYNNLPNAKQNALGIG